MVKHNYNSGEYSAQFFRDFMANEKKLIRILKGAIDSRRIKQSKNTVSFPYFGAVNHLYFSETKNNKQKIKHEIDYGNGHINLYEIILDVDRGKTGRISDNYSIKLLERIIEDMKNSHRLNSK